MSEVAWFRVTGYCSCGETRRILDSMERSPKDAAEWVAAFLSAHGKHPRSWIKVVPMMRDREAVE